MGKNWQNFTNNLVAAEQNQRFTTIRIETMQKS